MTAAQPEDPVRAGVRSLEVRWIFPGQLATATAAWFARFPVQLESRADSYLLSPRLPGLSAKIRAGMALEVKVYQGSPGFLEVAGRVRGRLEGWQKWSFPCGPLSPGSAPQPGWALVHKRRQISRFPPADGSGTPARHPDEELGCAVELTELRSRGETWWSLGFEATGPPVLLRPELEATAGLVFAQAFPGGAEFGPADCQSYADWLWR
jgi:hypothetical protein